MERIRCIEEVDVKEMEKRRYPGKYYTYITEVKWNDGKTEIIARRYSDFFDLHSSLMEEFPIESGVRNPRKRIVPFLPGKVFFLTENKARKRIPLIDEYCKQLIRLPTFITYNEVILNFFEQNADDKLPSLLNRVPQNSTDTEDKEIAQDISGPVELEQFIAIADFNKESSKEIALKAGEVVELLEKSDTGWWLVANDSQKRGWVPSAYLEDLSDETIKDENNNKTVRLEPGKGTWYVTLTPMQAESDDELSFNGGQKLEVLEQSMDGWWFARSVEGNEGWVPGSFLNKLHSGKNASAAETRRLSKRKVFKRAAPKRGTVHRSITDDQRQLARKTIKERLKKQYETEGEGNEQYVTIASFQESDNEGMSFEKGEIATVIQTSSNGWWLCRIGTREGWVPESYLEKRRASPQADRSNGDSPVLPPPNSTTPTLNERSYKPLFNRNPPPAVLTNQNSTPYTIPDKNVNNKSPRHYKPPSPSKSPSLPRTTPYFPQENKPPFPPTSSNPPSSPALPLQHQNKPLLPQQNKPPLPQQNKPPLQHQNKPPLSQQNKPPLPQQNKPPLPSARNKYQTSPINKPVVPHPNKPPFPVSPIKPSPAATPFKLPPLQPQFQTPPKKSTPSPYQYKPPSPNKPPINKVLGHQSMTPALSHKPPLGLNSASVANPSARKDLKVNNTVSLLEKSQQHFTNNSRSNEVDRSYGNDSELYYSSLSIVNDKVEPEYSSYSWYKDVNRQDAEEMLRSENKEGYYVVRKGKDYISNTPYSISIFHHRKVWHFHIRRQEGDIWAIGSKQIGETTFTSLPELVDFYTSHYLIIGDQSNSVILTGTPQ